MKDNLDIEKLFKDKFETFEPAVDAKVWQGIASGVGAAGSTSAISASAIWIKSLLIGAVAATVGIGAWVYFDKNETENSNVVNSATINQTIESIDEKLVASNGVLTPDSEQVFIVETNNSTEKSLRNITNHVAENAILPTNSNKDMIGSEVSDQPIVENDDVVTVATENTVDDVSAGRVSDQPEGQPSANQEPVENSLVVDSEVDKKTIDDNPSGELIEQENEVVETLEGKSFISEIPNIITPNNDRVNDEFFINENNIKNIGSFYIVIYTKQNIKVFESENPQFRWNGYDFGDVMVPKDVYFYLIKAVGNDGKTFSIPGQINVNY